MDMEPDQIKIHHLNCTPIASRFHLKIERHTEKPTNAYWLIFPSIYYDLNRSQLIPYLSETIFYYSISHQSFIYHCQSAFMYVVSHIGGLSETFCDRKCRFFSSFLHKSWAIKLNIDIFYRIRLVSQREKNLMSVWTDFSSQVSLLFTLETYLWCSSNENANAMREFLFCCNECSFRDINSMNSWNRTTEQKLDNCILGWGDLEDTIVVILKFGRSLKIRGVTSINLIGPL